jgi:ribosomal-protein-alanine N-acetyltransferase
MFQLETERLLIRPLTNADRPAFRAMSSDPEVMRYVHHGEPYTEREIDDFYARQARQLQEFDVCMGAMIEKASGRVVGLAGTQPLGKSGDYEIGWWLAREVWGRGYATEAGRAAMNHVLDHLKLPRVVAVIDPGNTASVRVVERLGFTYDRRYTGAELKHRLPDIVVDLFYRNAADREKE